MSDKSDREHYRQDWIVAGKYIKQCDERDMKTEINSDDLVFINTGLQTLSLALNGDSTGAQELVIDFLDNPFSPPLRPGWREAWKGNQKIRPWLGNEAWLGDVYSGHFSGELLSEEQWEYLHRVAISLVRLATADSMIWHKYARDAREVISQYLETVMTTTPE